MSCFVYPSLSLAVDDSTIKDLDNIFLIKKTFQIFKKAVLAGTKSEGGFEMLDCKSINSTFKIILDLSHWVSYIFS